MEVWDPIRTQLSYQMLQDPDIDPLQVLYQGKKWGHSPPKAIGQWISEGRVLDPGEAWDITVGQNSTATSQRILKREDCSRTVGPQPA